MPPRSLIQRTQSRTLSEIGFMLVPVGPRGAGAAPPAPAAAGAADPRVGDAVAVAAASSVVLAVVAPRSTRVPQPTAAQAIANANATIIPRCRIRNPPIDPCCLTAEP